MKQFFTLLVLLATCAGLFAKPVSPEKARQVASFFYQAQTAGSINYKKGAELKLAFTSSSKAYSATALTSPVNYFYAFNAGEKNGFVIISADDAVSPVLAYSTEGEISLTDMPVNAAKWLEGYRSQLQYVIENKIEASDEVKAEWDNYYHQRSLGKKETNAVSPLMQTKWNQSPHYNALCPYDNSRNERTVTGCVATAMAQVMKYWNYPEQGTGFHSYNHSKYGTISANFGNTKYEWSKMPNSVTSANNAVATLMQHCGVSVDMNYGVDVSGAYVINDYTAVEHCSEYALEKYFGYAEELKGVQRKNYTSADWEKLLKNELDANRPILYAGFGTGGGHAFVCDGYDNNSMFHFNWGWGGYYDGYFKSNALDPGGVGTGGGTGGYNSDQQAIIGIQPPNGGGGGGGTVNTDLQLYNYVSVDNTTAYYGGAFKVSTAIANLGTKPFTGDFCAAIFDNTGTFVDFVETKTNLQLDNGFYYNFEFTTTGMLSALPGKYSIGIFYKPQGGEWSIVEKGNYSNYAEISIINPNQIELYSSMVVTPGASSLVQNQPATVKVDFANFSTDAYSGMLDISLYKLDGEFAATVQTIENVTMCSNCHFTSPLSFTTANLNVAPGTYLLAAAHKPDGGSWQLIGSTHYTNPIKVIVRSPDIAADMYEDNNTVAKAYKGNLIFSNNKASFKTTGANMHNGADYDYYKLTLPAGYDYTISARVHDAESSTNGIVYTNDVLFSYSKDGSSWSDAYDAALPGKVNAKGNTTVYFMVAPYFQGSTGTYLLDVEITRVQNTAIEEKPVVELSISPNPASKYLNLTLSESINQVNSVKIVDISGREVVNYGAPAVKDKRAVLPVETLVDGVYFIVIETDKGVSKSKFIKIQ